MLAKANKYYRLLEPSLSKEQNRILLDIKDENNVIITNREFNYYFYFRT